jgi:hypothetical protein
MAPQITGEITMTYETKKQQRERFLAEFLRSLREAPPGTPVYMPVGDLFKDANVHSLDEWRAALRAAVVRDDDDDEGEDT